MLRFFTRLEKTRNFFILIFAILMVGSLVFFYTPSRDTVSANLAQSEEAAASVDGHDVTVGEIVRQKEQYSQFSQGRGFPTKTILDGMISSRISRIEAERFGLTASDAEVADAIRKGLKQPDGTTLTEDEYKENVTAQTGSVAAYERGVRDDISANKLRAFITSGVTVSEEEVLSDFQRKNAKFDLSYVAVSASELARKITPSDDELRAYFEQNKASYPISVPQKKIKYVFVNTEKLGQKLSITDADIQAEYDKLPADKRTAGVLGREIVLRVAKPEFDGDVQTKASQLIEQLRKDGETVSEDAFIAMAKGQSESPSSAANGGKLAGPVRENLNKPDDPYQQLLTMKPGEVSAPISYQGRYFILRRGEDVPKPIGDAKKELEVSLRNRRAYAVAAELAQKVVDSLKQTKDPLKTAQQFAGEANMSAAEMVRETSFIKPGDEVPNVGISPQFEEGIAPLANVGDVGEKTPIQNGFAVPVLVDKKEPRDAEFDEVKAQIVDIVKIDKARTQVEEIAKAIASGATDAGSINALATAKGLAAKDQKNFVLGSPLGEGASAGTNEAFETAVYALKAGEAAKTPFKIGDDWYVVGVTKREDASTEDFAKQRSTLIEQMLSSKRAAVFGEYLSATRQRYDKDGSVKIYKDVIAKIDAADGSALPVDEDEN
ncbi:MAG: SurA N-terminal domain-containing protein [Pyrinomonadaceae bacterium]